MLTDSFIWPDVAGAVFINNVVGKGPDIPPESFKHSLAYTLGAERSLYDYTLNVMVT